MSYSAVMVHMDLDQSNDARLQIAGSLAARFDAALIGVAAAAPAEYAGDVSADTKAVLDRKALVDRMAGLEWSFRALAEKYVSDIEWRCGFARPADYVAAQARAADILVAGTLQRGAAFDRMRSLDPAELVMKAGRPVFMIPPDVAWLKTKTMLVAWKEGREARRAVWDALPLLRCAQEVNVVAIAEGATTPEQLRPQVNDVVAWLGRHDILGFGMVPEPVGSAADQLAIMASEMDADVVIAGAFSRAQITERVFGGVTQSILTRTNRCTFLAH